MNFRHASAQRWLWLVIIAVIVTRVGGIHLHLCFDGLEPPASLHVSDGSMHNDEHHMDSAHVDKDVSLFDGVLLSKKASGPMDLTIAFVAVIVLLLLRSSGSSWPPAAASQIPLLPFFSLRPPLRGPPR